MSRASIVMTAAEWAEFGSGITPVNMQECIESDTGKRKIGNGTDIWDDLEYYGYKWDGMAVKSADTSRNTTTTLAADPDLQFAMEANTKYAIKLRVYFDTPIAAGWKHRLRGPSSPTSVRLMRRDITPGGTAWNTVKMETAFHGSDQAITGSATTGGYAEYEGVVANGANAGTFDVGWAQNSSDAGNTTVLAGSTLEWMKI